MLPSETDVVVVGAGPTGLALAIALQQAGIRHLLIDTLAQGQNTSRAAVIHAHTLEVLDGIGVADEITRRGLVLSTLTIRDRDRALPNLAFDTLASRHACLLMLPQDVTERVLADRLLSLGGAVHRRVTATRIEQGQSGVEVAVSSPAGESVVRARYAVGADGMHSTVRAAAGMPFEGAPTRGPSSWPTSASIGRCGGRRCRCSSPRPVWWSSRPCRTMHFASWRRWPTRRSGRRSPTSRP